MSPSPTSRRLEGRVAVITGASRGIGAAIAKRFAAEGAHLILVARTVGGLEEVDDEVKKLGGSATLCPFDLTDYAAIDRLDETHTIFGGEIETAPVEHSGTRRKSALRHTLDAGNTATSAVKMAAQKVADAYKKVI